MKLKGLRIPASIHHVMHLAHNPLHAIYFGLVAVESHHVYGLVAAVLLVISLVNIREA